MPKQARSCAFLSALFLTLAVLTLFSTSAFAQATIQSGNIQGTISDPGGLVVPGAKVTISNQATGQSLSFTANDNGFFNSGPLTPGNYKVRVEAKGFQTTEVTVPVQVGVISSGNTRLQVGSEGQVVTVEGTAIQVNTEQATVQGVLTVQQIENLPINGRNFLDLAQLEPGVQIQDASNFDPTKGGFTGISLGGRSGRTTRIEVDGLDISDETVGTTVANISASSIQEFQISQSSLDLSTELTSSGAVNVATRTGTNTVHGQGFYLFRDKALSASFPGGVDSPYQRNHFGGNLGGPIIPNKAFFFLSGERIKQDLSVPVGFAPPFTSLSGQISQPLREKILFGRLDFQLLNNAKLFYRFAYDNNSLITNTLLDYSVFSNLNNTPAHALGVDMTTGTFSHSFRFGYTKFANHISDAVSGSNVFNPAPDIQIRIGGFRSGPNPLAPQATFQSNKQFKYDGSKIVASHTLRYGVGVNRILGGGFANFFGIAPRIRSTTSAANQAIAAAGPFPGGSSNPLNYPVAGAFSLQLGNGQGFFTENPGFDLPAGGQEDTRFQAYIGDTVKLRPNFTLTLGLRYVRDTGRTNSDLAEIPCSSVTVTPAPCTGNTPLLEQFGFIPGLGKRIRQDNNNFGPQVGIAWDPFSNGKTVIRAGAGLFYENAIFNNVLFSRPAMLQQGLFNFVADTGTGQGCPGGTFTFPGGQVVSTTPGGLDIATQVCGQPIGMVASEIAALQAQYQAANAAAGLQANPQFIGELLSQNLALIAPNYATPYSYQFNAGIQRELARGLVVSADYVRNVNLKYLVGVDTNHVGDARFFDRGAANAAIAATLAACGVSSIDAGIAGCPNNLDPTGQPIPLTMEDFAGNGLASAVQLCGGPCGVLGLPAAAFPGINAAVGSNTMLFPIGRSVYNGLQVSLKQDLRDPLPFMRHANLQVSYSLSRFVTAVGTGAAGETNDQDFINSAPDFRNPLGAIGPGSFDRTHQFSMGTILEFPKALRLSFIAHVNSPLSQSMFVEDQGRAGEIYSTDFTGDGTTGDLLPGSALGAFMRNVQPGDLANVIGNYNSTAGGLTPAGQRLVAEGLFTPAQLASLLAVTDTLQPPPANLAGLGWLKTIDARVSVPIKIRERVTIEPSASFYNLFNFVNYDTNPTVRPQGVLNGVEGTISGTPKDSIEARIPERAFQSSGVFGLGSARQMEFGLRITF